MSDFYKITDNPGWVKNINNNSVLNADLSSLKKYKEDKQKNVKVRNIEQDVMNLKSDFNELKSDMTDIKILLTQLLNK